MALEDDSISSLTVVALWVTPNLQDLGVYWYLTTTSVSGKHRLYIKDGSSDLSVTYWLAASHQEANQAFWNWGVGLLEKPEENCMFMI